MHIVEQNATSSPNNTLSSIVNLFHTFLVKLQHEQPCTSLAYLQLVELAKLASSSTLALS